MAEADDIGAIAVPKGSSGLAGRLLASPTLPAFAARFAARRVAGSGAPWRFGSTVIAIAFAHVEEALSRDLDFAIAPINSGRIRDVDDAFVLGMDRHSVLAHERGALYRALTSVDLGPLQQALKLEVDERLDGQTELDVIGAYARPIASQTARSLFGIDPKNDRLFEEVARAIFGHTFLNLSGDKAIRNRAIDAAELLAKWFDKEIERRKALGEPGEDMMGHLILAGELDLKGIRRTLAGMLVGSIDTTASSVAKIIAVLGKDEALKRKVETDCDNLNRIWGWCLELLRRWPHNPILLRHALRETSLGGTKIAQGDRVILWTQAAMQDATAFPAPDELKPDRPQEAYLHFGGTLHCCAGRPINRWQIPILVAGLLRKGITKVGKISWAGSFPDRLMVRFAS